VVGIGYRAGYYNSVANQFIVRQSNVNSTPLIQGDFSTGNLTIVGNITADVPLSDSHLATKGYVDSATGGTQTGDLNMGGNDILNVNKLTANTVDPLYNIDNTLYSSYAPSMVGGVKEEYVGKTYIKSYNRDIDEYEYVIDFDKVKEGSDLWLWYKVIDYSEDKVDVLITPYGGFADVYYELEGNKIIFRSNKEIKVSYRLVANRFDWKSWPSKPKDQDQPGGLIIK